MITLTTIVYEGNFEKTLNDECWFFRFNDKLITHKLIVVNNLSSIDKFWGKIKKLRTNNSFEVVMVNDNENLVKKIFNLNIDNSIGYVYTIPYFVLLESISTPFILNVATDCMDDIKISDNFLELSINELKTNDLCSTTMVAWTKNNYVMSNNVTIGKYENHETFKKLGQKYKESENFNYSYGFTDQFFMGKVDKLKKIDYNISETISNKIYNGPSYGGNSFEKRIVGHQVNNNVYNCIFKGDDYYIHDNNYY